MRGTLDGLSTPHPIGTTLPALYADDHVAMQLCAGFDEVLAPIFATLDSLPAYLSPATAPADLLSWLAGWVGLPDPPRMPEESLRALIASAWQLHAWSGTVRGIQLAVRLALGADPEVTDSGGTTWSSDPHPDLPGEAAANVVIRVPAAAAREADLPGLRRLLGMVIPAHVSWRLVAVGSPA